jgi:hypothetical protein
MKLRNLNGKLVWKTVRRFLIDWDRPERSKFQFDVKKFLQKYWGGCVVYSEFPVYGSLLKIDIFNASRMVAVEVQGKQHQEYVKHFSGSRAGWLAQMKRDMLKVEFCDLNNITLLEILPEDMPLTYKFFVSKFNIKL